MVERKRMSIPEEIYRRLVEKAVESRKDSLRHGKKGSTILKEWYEGRATAYSDAAGLLRIYKR